jgi:hypothetical protein
MMGANTSWYEETHGNSLEQGDLLLNVPIIKIPPSFAEGIAEIDELELIYTRADLAIMTQSCDLTHDGKVAYVLFCLATQLSASSDFAGPLSKTQKDRLNNIAAGRYVHLHLLNQSDLPGLQSDFWLLQFTDLYTLPMELVRNLASKQGPRLRLLPPYREHLSQAFARSFMRVGLPADLPKFA